MDILDRVCYIYGIPDEGRFIVDIILRPEEQAFLLKTEKEKEYMPWEVESLAQEIYHETGKNIWTESLFHRGIISKTPDASKYFVASLYTRLDIFATEEEETYLGLSKEEKKVLDDWYFKEYVDWLKTLCAERPTDDKVATLEETLEFIENRNDTPYIAICDCRRLRKSVRTIPCQRSENVCITYRTAPNSFVKRGLVQPITKEKAKRIVIESHEEGLIHTINAGGICNCCVMCGNRCCYLFRAAYDMNSLGTWPEVSKVIDLDKSKCISCRKCMTRCQFNCFKKIDGKMTLQNLESCQGCGLCVSTCPGKALSLKAR